MILSDLSRRDLVSRLEGSGLVLQTGPFVSRVRSHLPQIVDGLSVLYADFPVLPAASFADVDVGVFRSPGLRRWILPRAYLLMRGQQTPFMGRFPTGRAVAFLEWGMNHAVFRQISSKMILHAAVLERDGRAVVLMGNSGAGKSTLCAALALSGWRLLSDELGLVDLEDGFISPVARPVSLKNESIDIIRRFSPGATLGPVCQTEQKGAVAHLRPPSASVQQMHDRAAPRSLVFVRYTPGARLNLERIPRAEAFPELSQGTFNYHELGEKGFRGLCQFLDQVECHRLNYSSLDDAVASFNSPGFLNDRPDIG